MANDDPEDAVEASRWTLFLENNEGSLESWVSTPSCSLVDLPTALVLGVVLIGRSCRARYGLNCYSFFIAALLALVIVGSWVMADSREVIKKNAAKDPA
jgi:hypothetical protein